MTVVLMDTLHHKTMDVWGGRRVLIPVVPKPDIFAKADPTAPCYRVATFEYQGDFLRGDPIFLQTSGPELPAEWWHL